MKSKDHLRGHPIYQDVNSEWRFCDTDELTVDTWWKRPCGHCGLYGNSNDGLPDPCLGELAGVTNACCGHGNPSESYICFTGGLVIRGFYIDRWHSRQYSSKEQKAITELNKWLSKHRYGVAKDS